MIMGVANVLLLLVALQDAESLVRSARRDHAGAIADLSKAIDLKPDDADLYFNRGNAWAAKEDHEKAINDYTKAVELKPSLAAAYMYRGDSQNRKGDPIGAMLDYGKAIELNSKDAEAYYRRGTIHYDRHSWADSLADFKKAWDLNALGRLHSDDCQLRLWLLRARAGEADAATKDLKQYVSSRSGRPTDWFSRIASFLAGETPEAQFVGAAQGKLQECDVH